MASKEEIWLNKRLGMITASELGEITSASGRIIDGCVDYIRRKRWERRYGFAHQVSSWQMEVGNQQEPYIFEWLKANYPYLDVVYSKNLSEIPFWCAPDCPLGASPDAYTADEKVVFEFKTLVGAKGVEFFGDEYTPYADKKVAVLKEHGCQIMGLFLSNPKVEEIWLIKYIYCDDNIRKDTDSPLASWRGLVFKFERKDYELSIAAMRERIILFDKMIDAPIGPKEFKNGNWRVTPEGELTKE